MAATDEMRDIALRLNPKAVCIVPERREERTTEGGLDVAGQHNRLVPIITALNDAGSRVSLFIEAVTHQIEAAARTDAKVVEFHTGAYAHALDKDDQKLADEILTSLKAGAKLAHSLGLEVHFGHGLTFDNVAPIAAIPEGMELNIGHFIIGEAVFLGLEAVISEMRSLTSEVRAP